MMGTKAIPIYIPAKRPRLGTIGKNHIQSSSNLSRTALFVVCSESDTFLKNYNIKTRGKLPGFIKRFLKLVADCKFCFFIKEMRFFHIKCEFDRISSFSCCTRINSCCNLSSVYIEV